MGYYLELPSPLFKALQLIRDHGAKPWDPDEDMHVFSKDGPVLICVVENGPFDAALICFDEQEYNRTTNPKDMRPRKYLTLPLEKVFELCGWKGLKEHWGKLWQ
jgi:hypothetical protein